MLLEYCRRSTHVQLLEAMDKISLFIFNISSLTVCLKPVFGMLAIAAMLRRKVAINITGAYLE